jgi:hypothetical protein
MLVGLLGQVGPRLGWWLFGPAQCRCQHQQQGHNALLHGPYLLLENQAVYCDLDSMQLFYLPDPYNHWEIAISALPIDKYI